MRASVLIDNATDDHLHHADSPPVQTWTKQLQALGGGGFLVMAT